jgi:NTP pyrophosphatase (non-canonical NTP hydrolase)
LTNAIRSDTIPGMNLKVWERKGVPLEVLALKLCEEAGEVSKEITDGWRNGEVDRRKLKAELDHVIDIAKILKDRC